ncbi:hypothetical protein KJ885_01150 [Patescibacteria group bacterium]|nr:hypothetical protein [Patescibacteria group bacterium]
MKLPVYLKYILVALFAALFFGLMQANKVFVDPDSFYHTKIAVFMLKQGIVRDFPWLVYTTLPEIYTDHHFLYHIILLPFVKFIPPLIGSKVAAVFINTGFILLFYGFLRNPHPTSPLERGRKEGVWPFFFVFILLSGAPFIFRIDLVKASGFSLIFIMLILFALFRRRHIWLVAISFFYVWAYGGWPLGILLSGIFLVSSMIANMIFNTRKEATLLHCYIVTLLRRSEWKPLVATVLGSLAGLVINPYFPQNLKFYWIQIVQIAVVNSKIKIGVGAEWYGFELPNLVNYSAGIFLVLGVAMLFFFGHIMVGVQNSESLQKKINYKAIRDILFFTICAGTFFVLTIKSCRNTEYSFPFMLLAGAFILKYFYDKDVYLYLKKNFLRIFRREILYKIFLIYLVLMLGLAFGASFKRVKNDLSRGFGFEKYKKAMEIAQENTKKDEIIFHSDWDDWPILFYHNTYNKYIVGLDARFMSNYNSELYEKWRDICWGKYENDVYPAIKQDFNAKIIFIAEGDIEKMDKYFKDDNRYKLLYNHDAKVYKLK